MKPTQQQQSTRNPIALWTERLILAVVAAAVLLYLADWGIFLLRGRPLAQVAVHSYLTVPLKGNKTEYDYVGTQPASCARTLFPQGGTPPCWYLRRHTTQAARIGLWINAGQG